MPQVDTHCPYCALQCGMSLDGARVTPRDFPVNAGGLCQKGWTSGSLLTSPKRLTTPLLRVNGVGQAKLSKYGEDVLALVGETT